MLESVKLWHQLRDVRVAPGTERDGGCTGGEDQAQPEDAQEDGTHMQAILTEHSPTNPSTATEQKHIIFNLKTLAELCTGRHLGEGKGLLRAVAAAPHWDGGVQELCHPCKARERPLAAGLGGRPA